MKAVHGANWLHYASRAAGGAPNAPLDAYGLLKTMIDHWRDVFDDAFGAQRQAQGAQFRLDGARGAQRDLASGDRAAGRRGAALPRRDAPAAEAGEGAGEAKSPSSRSSMTQQRQSGLARAPAPRQRRAARAAPKLDLADRRCAAKALKPWIEVALPHPDVLANRFKEAEFAADLFAVDAGPCERGLRDAGELLPHHLPDRGPEARADHRPLQRLGGSGGDPVIGLQTAFGGGKTHTMLAVYPSRASICAMAAIRAACRASARSSTRRASTHCRSRRSRCSSARRRAPTSR